MRDKKSIWISRSLDLIDNWKLNRVVFKLLYKNILREFFASINSVLIFPPLKTIQHKKSIISETNNFNRSFIPSTLIYNEGWNVDNPMTAVTGLILSNFASATWNLFERARLSSRKFQQIEASIPSELPPQFVFAIRCNFLRCCYVRSKVPTVVRRHARLFRLRDVSSVAFSALFQRYVQKNSRSIRASKILRFIFNEKEMRKMERKQERSISHDITRYNLESCKREREGEKKV